MKILIQIGQLLLSLSILIILHELGHFIFARIFKTRVEKFYLFFDPWFSFFKMKRGDTEYGIGWLPLGGYVKISGMLDESMDKEQLKKPPQPYEFRSKPGYQRLLIMLGGVSVNLLLGFLIYTAILFVWGEKYLPNKNITDGIWVMDSILYEAGLSTGDKIISINGKEPERFTDVFEEMLYGGTMQIQRSGKDTTLIIPEDLAGRIADSRIYKKGILMYPRIPLIIVDVADSSLNKSAGLLPKDMIWSVAGIHIKYADQLPAILDSLKGQTIPLEVKREGNIKELKITVNDNGKIGISYYPILSYDELEKLGYYKFETNAYSLIASIPAGFHKAKESLKSYIRQFKLIFNFGTGAYKGIGGFGAIGGLFPPHWDWQVFWEITAFLSIMLAFLNVLPIPALDGGHVTFLIYEMITGRKPGDKFLEYAQIVGMIILLFLVVYANGNDLYRMILRLIGK